MPPQSAPGSSGARLPSQVAYGFGFRVQLGVWGLGFRVFKGCLVFKKVWGFWVSRWVLGFRAYGA